MNEPQRQKLGQRLLGMGLVNEHQLARALQEQTTCGDRLGSILVKLGFVEEARLAVILSRVNELECVNLTGTQIPIEMLALVSGTTAHTRCVLPTRIVDGVLYLAVADRAYGDVLTERGKLLDLKISPLVAPSFRLKAAIEENYGPADLYNNPLPRS